MSHSHDDYYEPPSEYLRDKAMTLRRSGQSDHSGAYLSFLQSRALEDLEYQSAYDTYHSPMQWVSPMLLRKYAPEHPPKERKGLFSSPFIKRKGSLDSKVIVNNVVEAHRKSRFQRQISADEHSQVSGHLRTTVANGCSDRVAHSALRMNGVDRLERLSHGSGSSQSLSSTLSRNEHTFAVEVHRDSNGEGSSHSSIQDLSRSPQRGGSPLVSSSRLNPNDSWVEQKSMGGSPQSVIDCSTRLSSSVIYMSQVSSGNAPPPPVITGQENILYMKVQDGSNLTKGPRDSPDLGVEDTSPTGTLDSTASEDFKDSKYGSSSTMSIGSDASPVAEQRKGQNRHRKANGVQVSL